jgi:8-oxo-dGTP pyrophosphatase MutT (NUDIX family)
MKSLEEIKALYPDVDINQSGGTDAYQEGLEVIERDPVAVVIKHPNEELYLIADWKKSNWKGLLTGGVEDGDSVSDTVKKEIHEETGYKNISTVTEMDCVSHGLFFHPVKNVNRLAHYHLVFAQLTDLEKDEISDEEKAIAEFVWIPKDEVLDLLTRNDMKKLWGYYLEKIIK